MEIVSTLTALEALQPQWLRLWREDLRATPFQSPAWLLPWARQFAPDRTRALALHRGGALVALLPFFTWQGCVLLAGTGPSDYGDGLFAPGHEDAAAPMLAQLAVAARQAGCSCIDLQQLRPCSPLLRAADPPQWRAQISDGDACPVTRLVGDDGLGGVSTGRRKNLAYAARAWGRDQAYELHLAGIDQLDDALSRIAQLHAQRWRGHDESRVFADPRTRAFFVAALHELVALDQLRLHLLRVVGEIAAAALVMQGRGDACLYLCTFDARWSRYSPGLLAIAAAMRNAAAEGAREFHFLRGREAYKFELGACDMPTSRRVLHA